MRIRQLIPKTDWPHLAALLVVVLLAQSAALSHLDLDDRHATDGVCALCIGASSLSAGNLAAVPCFDQPALSEPSIEFVGFSAGVIRLDHCYARGPPQAS